MNAPERQALTVTELNTLAKEYLENLPLFRSVSVKGELSNVTLHRTGHIYFSNQGRGRGRLRRDVAQRRRFAAASRQKTARRSPPRGR